MTVLEKQDTKTTVMEVDKYGILPISLILLRLTINI